MKKHLKKHIVNLVLVVCLALMPARVSAENHTVGSGKISFKTVYRTGGSAWNKHIRQGRAILDEMVANKGPDKTLNEFNWSNLALRASYGEHWIKKQDETRFREVLRDIEKSQQAMENRANEIESLRNSIASELAGEKARWDQLLAGDSIEDHLLKALGIEVAGKIGSEFFGWLGKKISSKVATGAGKVIGPISTIVSLYQFFNAYDEYAEMKLMLDRLLERTEMVAYLDVLLKQYDQLIAAQDKVLDELLKTYSIYSKSTCR